MIDLRLGDCREILATLEPDSIDACVTDPPYHLTSIVKRFGGANAAQAQYGTDGAYRRASAGFMGKTWDGGSIAQDPATWAAVYRVLKPGAHLLAFSGTRTQHRMVCAIEDAGFEVRDQIGWAFGSGFPKSHNQPGGWGTALKPAWEPICVARKPLIGTVAANVLQYGTGALNIDGCRISPVDAADIEQQRRVVGFGKSYGNGEAGIALAGSADGSLRNTDRSEFDPTRGRWPANLIHDGSVEVLACFPSAPGQSGAVTGREPSSKTNNVYGTFDGRSATSPRGDTGSAARFFYCAKVSKADRGQDNKHPTVKPTALMRYLCRLVTPPGGTVLDPFMGSGSTGKAAIAEGFKFIGVELEAESMATARRRLGVEVDVFA